MRLSSVTHTVNNDQRRIPLVATTPDGVNYTTTLSSDSGVLIAGYYMLFAIGPTGVPSMAYTLLIT
jgi:galactose oxidase